MTDQVTVEIRTLPHGEGLPVPEYATALSAGLDLRAAVAETERLTLEPGHRAVIPTGIQIALPEGFEAQVRPRSGLAIKHGISVLNSPGTIDADYRGEVGVILVNHGHEPFEIARGDRIAQLVVARFARVSWETTEELVSTERGVGGFGHTGK